MSEKFKFRLIQKEDNTSVARLIRSVMTEFGAVGEGYSIMDEEVDEMWENYTNDKSCFFVIVSNDKIVGCGGVGPLRGGDEATCELKKMYFNPEIRGHGLGTQIVERSLAKAKELGYKTCYLETLERMEAANYLYEKMGFKLLEKPMGCTGHEACDRKFAKEL